MKTLSAGKPYITVMGHEAGKAYFSQLTQDRQVARYLYGDMS